MYHNEFAYVHETKEPKDAKMQGGRFFLSTKQRGMRDER